MTSFLALACAPAVAWAEDKPLYQPMPAWVVAAPEPDFAKLTDSDPALVVMDVQQRIVDQQVWGYTDQAMRVVSAQMLSEIGQLKLPWQPDAGDLIIHRAEIVRGGQHIDLIAQGQRFQVLQREEQLERLMLTGTLTATLSVEGLRVGDVLRLSYSVTERDKALQGNVQTVVPLLGEQARAGFARTRLSWADGTPLVWRTYADGLKPKTSKRDGFNEVEFALPLAKQPELPNDAPARYRKLPILEAGSFADWKAVSKTMAPLYKTEGLAAAGSPLAAEIAKIAAKSADPRTRAALALQLVQDEVRYLFRGMDGGNYIPQAPDKTWSVRYGDCKAKTMLLLTVLHGLGIEAEPVLASSEMGDFVPGRLPSAAAFDHVIARATIDGKSLWLDGTSSGARIDDLEDVPPFRNVLPLRDAGSDLMAVPMRAPKRAVAEADITFDQSAGLSLPTLFSASMTLRGQMAEMMRVVVAQADKDGLDKMADGFTSDVLGGGLVSDRSIRYDAATATAVISVSGLVSTSWTKSDGRYRFVLDKTVGAASFEPDRARPAWTGIPVASSAPATAITRYRVRLPGGGAGFELEGDTVLPAALAGARVVRKSALQNGVASVEDRVEEDGAEIAAADVAAERAKVALAKTRLLEVVAPADYAPRWKVVEAARRSNGFAPILKVYAKAISTRPDEVVGYTNRANFYLGVWDWKSAIPDLDKAIGIEPSIDLYLQRSGAKEALGQNAAALADAEAALALDPGSMGVIGRVARLRFRAGKRDEALAMLAERVAAGGKEKPDFVSAQADLLGEAGRVDEAVAAMDAVIKTNPGNATLLNSRCWLKGTRNVQLDTALKDCTRAIELAEVPASIYDSRALVYYRMGRMDDALADLDAALEVAPGQVASLFLRGVVRTRVGNKLAAEDLAAARLMSPTIDKEYADYGVKP